MYDNKGNKIFAHKHKNKFSCYYQRFKIHFTYTKIKKVSTNLYCVVKTTRKIYLNKNNKKKKYVTI